MKDKVCKSCNFVGKPTSQGLDSFLVDALLWMMFLGIAAIFALLPLLLIPLAWTIYHIATYFSVTCPKCGDLEMVRISSPESCAKDNKVGVKSENRPETTSSIPVYQEKASSSA